MQALSENMKLSIESQTKNLALVRDFVSAAAKNVGFDDISINNILIAVDEACTNIIKHAYEYKPDKTVDISITLNDNRFNVIIKDEGKSFEPNKITSPNMNEYFKQYRVGGLGMHLMKTLMNEVIYQSEQNYNQVILSKNLP
jgi:serine/threonine-protein kinase RsbW